MQQFPALGKNNQFCFKIPPDQLIYMTTIIILLHQAKSYFCYYSVTSKPYRYARNIKKRQADARFANP